jgi:hypothetical protein
MFTSPVGGAFTEAFVDNSVINLGHAQGLRRSHPEHGQNSLMNECLMVVCPSSPTPSEEHHALRTT